MGRVYRFADARARLADGFYNIMSRLGTGADRNTHGGYFVPILTQQQIEAAYRTSWLTKKVHNLIPFEMTRAGRAWQAKKDQIAALETLETKLQLWLKIEEALRTARLHGGSAIVLGVRQGSPDQEVRPEALGKNSLRYAVVVSRHQLNASEGFETDPESDYFGQPAMWEMRGQRGNRVRIHPSRIIPFKGSPLPVGSLTLSQIDQFWGDPLLVSIKSAIDNAETVQAAIATLLHEMKQDVISMPGLTEQIATEGAEEKIVARVDALAKFKSMFNMLLLDGGDGTSEFSGEKWETRELSFAQHPDLLRAFLGVVAGAADIPVTRLMGESPGGLQSTGKGEQYDFNRMLSAQQTATLAPQLARIDDILIPSALGSRPEEITYEFVPLEEPGPQEVSNIEMQEATTVKTYADTGLIPSDALAKATVNRLIESGRWPGLDQAIDESPHELGEEPPAIDPATGQPTDPANADLPPAANENDVQAMQRRGTVTRDQAITLLTDASPRSLYVSRRVLNADEVIAWAKGQGFKTVVTAADLHVTVLFSRTPVDWMKVGEFDGWSDEADGKLTIPPGGPRLMEVFGSAGNRQAAVLAFRSTRLIWRHEEFVRNGASHDYNEYQPHVTITYDVPEGFDVTKVEPYQGRLLLGPEIFAEVVDEWSETISEA